MNYFAVIDTNVLVSSMLKGNSLPGYIVSMALQGPIIPLLNEEILQEYEDVLLRNKFGFDEVSVKDVLAGLKKRAVFLNRTISEEKMIDPDDVVFYEIVLTARRSTEAYLVTGNGKHYPRKAFVVTPREMLEIMNVDFEKEL